MVLVQKFKCNQCEVRSRKGYKYSNFCRKCSQWKPKTITVCECCQTRLRTIRREKTESVWDVERNEKRI